MNKTPLLAREGWPFIAISLAAALIVHVLLGWVWALPLWLVAIFCLQFFRDPPRASRAAANEVLSGADGKVIFVGDTHDPYLDRNTIKISVFMNVFNVHSNRSPVAGKIRQVWYRPGKFLNAAFDKAALDNEQNALWIETDSGHNVTCVQIAGLVARRILCYVESGDRLTAGQRFGFIRFGSRVDLYLPPGSKVRCTLGDKVKAGIDVLAELPTESAA